MHQMAALRTHGSGWQPSCYSERQGRFKKRGASMVRQLFEVLFVVSLFALVAAPVVGVLLLAWPRKPAGRSVRASQIHAHV